MNLLSLIFSNTIIAFIILISIIVFVHELGHFLAGKIFKIQVEEFSLGFGPTATSFKKGNTVYRINWLPLGGYVRFYGADLEEIIPLENQSKSLLHAHVYKRALISFSGPFANFLLSFFIMLGLVWHGIPTQSTVISVLPHSVADSQGLQSGDKIIKINDKDMENWPDLVKVISKSVNKPLNFIVERNNQKLSIPITPISQNTESIYGVMEKTGKIGVTPFFSQPAIIPNKGDFFDLIGIGNGDRIISINDKKINYFHEIFIVMSNILNANSDALLAQKIIHQDLPNQFLTFTIIKKGSSSVVLKINLNSEFLRRWAYKILLLNKKNKDFENAQIPWIKKISSTDLTFRNFQTVVPNNHSSIAAWKACGLETGMTFRALNHISPIKTPHIINLKEENIISIFQILNFFERSEQYLSANQSLMSNIFSINVHVTTQNGENKELICKLPIDEKKDNLNKKIFYVQFPLQFYTQPESMPPILLKAHTFLDGLNKAFHYLVNQMSLIYNGLKMLFSGTLPLSNLGGPIAVASIAGEAAKAGLITFLLTMSLISVNIGMVNLLPLPALDGGALLLYAVEASYGKSLPKKVQITVQRIGILLILFLFILVFYNDIIRLLK